MHRVFIVRGIVVAVLLLGVLAWLLFSNVLG